MNNLQSNSILLRLYIKPASFLVRLSKLLTLSILVICGQIITSKANNLSQSSESKYSHQSIQKKNFIQQKRTISSQTNTENRIEYNDCFNEVLTDFSADDDSRLNGLTALPSGIQMLKNLKSMEGVQNYFQNSCGTFKPDYFTAQIQRESQEILIQPELSSHNLNNETAYYINIVQESLSIVDPKNTDSFQKMYQSTQPIRDLVYIIRTSDLGLSQIHMSSEIIELVSKSMSQIQKIPFEMQLSYVGTILSAIEDPQHCSGFCQMMYAHIISLLVQNPDMKEEFIKRLEIGNYSSLYSLKLSLMKGRPLTKKELEAYEPKKQECGLNHLWGEFILKIDQQKLMNYISINKDICGNYIALILKNQNAQLIINEQARKRIIEVKFKVESARELIQILTDYKKDTE